MATPAAHQHPPGIVKPRRFRPRPAYELLTCGLRGHELVGMDAASLRPRDAVFVRESGGLRWYRCLRCDSWLPVPPPTEPTREVPPERDEIDLPLRGRPLRDRFVLRLIAIDRALHFVLLGLLAAVVFLIAAHHTQWEQRLDRVLTDWQGGVGGATARTHSGILGELDKFFSLSSERLELTGLALVGYAVLEGIEAVGLWYAKRWAEYLTFVATVLLLPLEIYELTTKVSALKIIALVINLAIAAYLIWAKRLFGVRGGVKAEHAAREHDSGWAAIDRATPHAQSGPSVIAKVH